MVPPPPADASPSTLIYRGGEEREGREREEEKLEGVSKEGGEGGGNSVWGADVPFPFTRELTDAMIRSLESRWGTVGRLQLKLLVKKSSEIQILSTSSSN